VENVREVRSVSNGEFLDLNVASWRPSCWRSNRGDLWLEVGLRNRKFLDTGMDRGGEG
jgi:hypothetical protein